MTHKVNIQHLHFLSSHLSTRMQTTPTLYCQIFTNIEQKSSTRFSSFEFMKSQRHTNQNLPKIWVKNFEIALFFLFLSLKTKTKTFSVTKQTMWFKSVNCTFSNKTPKSFTLTPTHTAAHRHTQSQITPHLLTITYTKPHTHTLSHIHTQITHTTTSPHKATHTQSHNHIPTQSHTHTHTVTTTSTELHIHTITVCKFLQNETWEAKLENYQFSLFVTNLHIRAADWSCGSFGSLYSMYPFFTNGWLARVTVPCRSLLKLQIPTIDNKVCLQTTQWPQL